MLLAAEQTLGSKDLALQILGEISREHTDCKLSLKIIAGNKFRQKKGFG